MHGLGVVVYLGEHIPPPPVIVEFHAPTFSGTPALVVNDDKFSLATVLAADDKDVPALRC